MSLVVYNPTGGPVAEKAAMARRDSSLKNGVLGVIDNGKLRSDKVLNRIVKGIESTYQLKDVIVHRKESASHAIDPESARGLAEKCDFVIAGIGD